MLWVPERFEVTDASASLYGGTANFDYRLANLGQRGVPRTATFDASYQNVDLTEFTNSLEWQGIRLAGRASGTNLLVWPLGRFADYPAKRPGQCGHVIWRHQQAGTCRHCVRDCARCGRNHW